jgi:energy-coupling factor transporter transmembrane protein EcfT
MTTPTFITALLKSRKAWICVIAMVVIAVFAFRQIVTGKEALDFIKWLVMTWIAAIAVEDGAQKLMIPPTQSIEPKDEPK